MQYTRTFYNLTLLTALTAALAPAQVLALGVGQIHLKSALNQTLNADIELLADTDEMHDIRVSLADAEAFAAAEVERYYWLSGLKFELRPEEGQQHRIHISSQAPIREPFLNFLLAVDSPTKHLVREYTVLMDPPNDLDLPSHPSRILVAPEESSSPGLLAKQPGGYQYGPVRAHDTLWSIAKRMPIPGVSTAGVTQALLTQNPQAFLDGDVNKLKKGQILRFVYPQPGSVPAQPSTRQVASARKQLAAASESPVGVVDAAVKAEVSGESMNEAVITQIQKELSSLQASGKKRDEYYQSIHARVDELSFKLDTIQQLLTQTQDSVLRGQETETAVVTNAANLSRPVSDTALNAATDNDDNGKQAQQSAGAELQANIKTEAQIETEIDTKPAIPGMAEVKPPVSIEYETERNETPALSTEQGVKPVLPRLSFVTVLEIGIALFLLYLMRQFIRQQRQLAQSTEGDLDETAMTVDSSSDASISTATGVQIDTVLAQESTVAEADDSEFTHDSEFTQALSEIPALPDFAADGGVVAREKMAESDLVSEAEVYAAYGNYRQAEQLIKHALAANPESGHLQSKLREIRAAHQSFDPDSKVEGENDVWIDAVHTAEDTVSDMMDEPVSELESVLESVPKLDLDADSGAESGSQFGPFKVGEATTVFDGSVRIPLGAEMIGEEIEKTEAMEPEAEHEIGSPQQQPACLAE